MNVICTQDDLQDLLPKNLKLSSEVIVSHFNERGIAMMEELRNLGDHRPLLFVAAERDAEKLAQIKNCCGGGILPPFTKARMKEALERVSKMKHGYHCE